MSDTSKQQGLTRRQLVQRGASATAALLLTACVGDMASEEREATPSDAIAQRQATEMPIPPSATAEPNAASAQESTAAEEPVATESEDPMPAPSETAMLEPTPACDDDDDDPTLAQTEGPFYTPSTPERTSFLEDGPGTKIVVTGRVLTTNCQPIADALLDFWHASDAGGYDNVGYTFRGHQFTDANGNYRLETIVPGLYPGRTRHFHVKVQGPSTTLLTTQLYFPDEPRNEQDGIFHPALLLEVQDAPDGKAATFDFVLA
ncbi:MAG: dioxygenase [Chloroflexota bacterium]|nr:dioxygenase [Chloroflexota bacterium]